MRWAVAFLLCVALAIWAAIHTDFVSIWSILQQADLVEVFVAMPLLILVVWALRAVRWIVIIRSFGLTAPVLATYLSIGASLGLAAVTPAQTGEVLKLSYLKADQGISLSHGAGGLVAERLADVMAILLLMVIASMQIIAPAVSVSTLIVSIAILALCVAFATLVTRHMTLPSVIMSVRKGFVEVLRRPGASGLVFVLTLGCWLVTSILWQTALHSIGLQISVIVAILLVGVVMLTTVLSFLPAGVGVSEVTIVAILNQQGFGADEALAAAAILRVITLMAMGLGLVHWIALARTRAAR